MDKEIADMREKQAQFTSKWQLEKKELNEPKNAKGELEKAKLD